MKGPPRQAVIVERPRPTYTEAELFGTSMQEDSKGPVPVWLSDTVASLKPQHPLRELIPTPTPHIPTQDTHISTPRAGQRAASFPSKPTVPSPPSRADEPEDAVFAFRPPTRAPEAVPTAGATTGLSAFLSSFDPDSLDAPLNNQFLTVDASARVLRTASSLLNVHDGPTNVPFSTPGPSDSLLDLTVAKPAQSNYASHSIPSELKDLDVPFSTPGPMASTRSSLGEMFPRTLVSQMSASPRSLPNPILMQKGDLTFIPNFPQPTASLSREHASYPTSITRPCALPVTAFGDTLNPISVSEPMWSSSPVQLPAGIPAPYSTPGPFRVYFDSPIEDPIGSDPLEPTEYELDLDYDCLDFRWEKFDRGDKTRFNTQEFTVPESRHLSNVFEDQPRSERRQATSTVTSHRAELDAGEPPSPRDQQYAPRNAESPALHGGTHSFDATDSDSDTILWEMPNISFNAVDRHTTPTIDRTFTAQQPAFAHAPGIHTSPSGPDIQEKDRYSKNEGLLDHGRPLRPNTSVDIPIKHVKEESVTIAT
ncbi:hypothetical protein PHLCEN_2v277 [Hermanssonia centrifuga]|uniref:Uncharacterized protein n=1 Tax=Hermanssonia centrifuga TaxID=98765 RepID=A0A2R6S6G8_9APHY|nr:hypothetical protein PHLCEN_2v277 [Hermanssonia centrifuga]